VQTIVDTRLADVLYSYRRALWAATGRREHWTSQRCVAKPACIRTCTHYFNTRELDISLDNPLQKPHHIALVIPPPDVPDLAERLPESEAPEQHFERALLRSLGYVLEFEADTRYPTDVDVYYSYRSAPFDHAQFVHSSGSAFVQILGGADGFLFLSNRLFLSHRPQPDTADTLRNELEELCQDEEKLRQFWEEEIAELPEASSTQ
jgi:hypothetical protein